MRDKAPRIDTRRIGGLEIICCVSAAARHDTRRIGGLEKG